MDYFDPAWLTERLCSRGHLTSGAVTGVEVTKSEVSNAATVHHLKLRYAANGRSHAPTHLFLKIDSARNEQLFYSDVYAAMGNPAFIPYCYDAGDSYLLLQDVSETHFSPDFPFAYFEKYAADMVDLLAWYHKFWWEHDWLGTKIGDFLTHERVANFIAEAQEKYHSFRAYVGNRLPKKHYQILDLVINHWPHRRYVRLVNGQGVTLVHRDTHPYNFMYPYARQPLMLVDWQSWRVDVGMDDVAYMILTHCFPETRRKLEWSLLKRYHQKLGMRGYSWGDCQYDYRASIVRSLFILIKAWTPDKWEHPNWRNRITYILQAFDDLQCSDIFI